MLKVKANKKLVQNHLSKLSGKNITLKDLHNMGSKINGSGRNDVEQLITEMKSIPGTSSYTMIIVFLNNVTH